MDTSIILSSAALQVAAQSQSSGLLGMSMWGILAAVVFSGVGLIYVRYGKTTSDIPMMVCGVLLMGYPYLSSNTAYLVLTGLGLSFLPHLLARFQT